MAHRALVIGVSGFLGGFLAEHLLECGDAVLGTSADGRWEPASPAGVRNAVELLHWDVGRDDGLSAAAWRQIVEFRPSRVYHLAGLSVPGDCGDAVPSPVALAVNVEGTRRVLERVAELAERPRLFFASTSHVYQPVAIGAPPVTEDYPAAGRSPYGRTKLLAEAIIGRAVAEHGCEAVIGRLFQHVGPRQNARMMLASWARQFAVGRRPVEIWSRDVLVDVLDVRDGVRAMRLLLEHGERGAAYNVGSGVGRWTGEIFDLLRQMADPAREVVELHPGRKQDPVADVARLTRATGWRARIPLMQTVADTWAWWRKQTS